MWINFKFNVMQTNNRNKGNSLGTIFTLLAFVLGFILYIILRQSSEDKDKEVKTEQALVPKRKRLPKKVIKPTKVEEEIETIKLSERQQKIVKQLIEKGKMYPSELQDLLSTVSARTVRRDMNDLEKKGLVEQKGTTKSTYYVYIGN
jgi:predicted HTH transcriptional regulator